MESKVIETQALGTPIQRKPINVQPKRGSHKQPASKGIMYATTAGYGLTVVVIMLFMLNGIRI
ncbi:hypothetical protein [Photobacterium nomapromontoriensis]|uniref:hypothetical protein n=1 Tax=Photobacterium nomapromontoriensis TaxID=2910237 RepID=UPI003D0C6F8A